MADPFVAEIRIFPFGFAPPGWAFCDGQVMPISQNVALFSLLGTTYGGDGKSTFALPDLRGRAPMHPDQGPGLSPHGLGEKGGSETVALEQRHLPGHTHGLAASGAKATEKAPVGNLLAAGNRLAQYASPGSSGGTTLMLSSQAMAPAGQGEPHANMQPYLTICFCIALQGVFPSRP
jgi:microcystin-dependent protein